MMLIVVPLIISLLLVFCGFPLLAIFTMIFGLYLLFSDNYPKFGIHLFARLTNRHIVMLRDFSGETRMSIAKVDSFGHMVAYWYWYTNLCLLENGGVVGNGNYVKQWRYLDDQPAPDYSKGWKRDIKQKEEMYE